MKGGKMPGGLQRLMDGMKVDRMSIIKFASKEKYVESCVKAMEAYEAQNNPRYEEDLKDLSQDIYLSLLEMEPMKLKEIFDGGKLKDYIFLMVKQNVQSKNSRYYYMYKKPVRDTINIEEYNKEIEGDEEE